MLCGAMSGTKVPFFHLMQVFIITFLLKIISKYSFMCLCIGFRFWSSFHQLCGIFQPHWVRKLERTCFEFWRVRCDIFFSPYISHHINWYFVNEAELMSGLKTNDLDNFSHLLTGYVGSASFLEQVYTSVKQLKEKNPNLVYGRTTNLSYNFKN